MDQLICASFSHTHFLYEVDMLKVSAVHLADDVSCLYNITVMFRSSTKGSFLIHLGNTSIEMYYEKV